MSLMDESLRLHAADLNEAAGECVTIVRGPKRTEDVTAVRTKTQASEFPSEAELRIVNKMLDWLIDADQYQFDDEPTEPEKGDFIITESGKRYEVRVGPNDETFRPHDDHEIKFRIHTLARPIVDEPSE